jgi:hypothetical protein
VFHARNCTIPDGAIAVFGAFFAVLWSYCLGVLVMRRRAYLDKIRLQNLSPSPFLQGIATAIISTNGALGSLVLSVVKDQGFGELGHGFCNVFWSLFAYVQYLIFSQMTLSQPFGPVRRASIMQKFDRLLRIGVLVIFLSYVCGIYFRESIWGDVFVSVNFCIGYGVIDLFALHAWWSIGELIEGIEFVQNGPQGLKHKLENMRVRFLTLICIMNMSLSCA